jgi:outer membrane lipoprotein LolB
MSRLFLLLSASICLCACATAPPSAAAKKPWSERMQQLQAAQHWDLQGRAAGAVGNQGWQANLDWRQSEQVADVRLAGPFGAGAVGFKLTPQGLNFAAAAPGADHPGVETSGAATPGDYLQHRLGFEPPFEDLRYWLLGVPNPAQAFEFKANEADRAAQLTQDGWTIEYGEYAGVGADVLPKKFTLRRDAVRVRIAVDRWNLSP